MEIYLIEKDNVISEYNKLLKESESMKSEEKKEFKGNKTKNI